MIEKNITSGNGLKGDAAEEAYVHCLLEASLCQGEDRQRSEQRLAAVNTAMLDCTRLQEYLEKLILEKLEKREFDETYAFLGYILFEENKFLFEKILDKWVRYYYILLEITACEKNRGLELYAVERFSDWREFEKVLWFFKTAFRRIWFGFTRQQQRLLVELADRYQVSVDFVAVLCKGAVHEDYVAAVLETSAALFADEGRNEMTGGLLQYAAWYATIHPAGRKCAIGMNCDNGLTVVHLMAGREEENTREKPEKEKKVEKAAGDSEKSKEIACILCANDMDYVNEVIIYLRRQKLPEGFRLCLYAVWDARSMAAGYNLAMKASTAEYKIYMHQDTFLCDEEYISKLVEMLQKTDYAMLGLAGTKRLPESGRWWDSKPEDMHFCLYQDFTLQMFSAVTNRCADARCQEMECIDGVLMAAKVHIPWREDILEGFHFYDISQSMEFWKRDLKVGIFENGGQAGVLHEVNVSKNESYERGYERARMRFLNEYRGGRSDL